MIKKVKKLSTKVSARTRDTFILPKFALQIHNLISSKYKNTYVVGGAVRNLLLNKKVIDVDIATSATPSQIAALLEKEGIAFTDEHKRMGVVIAKKGSNKIEITTFRKEAYNASRFPKVTFVTDIKTDSNRRDFTINALYYNPQTKEILDFHNGLKDLQNKRLKFIGKAEKRIQEDALRIVRAYRFKLKYKFKLGSETETILQKNILLLKKVSATRLQKEIFATKNISLQKTLQKVIHRNY